MVGRARWGCLESTQILLQVGNIIAGIRGLELMRNRFKAHAGLGHEGFIFSKAFNEIPLMRLLLSPPRRLRGNNTTLDVGFDAVGTRLLFIATDFSLLAQHA